MNFIGFGDGSDGDLVLTSVQTINTYLTVNGSNPTGQAYIKVDSTSGISVGDAILIIKMRGSTNHGKAMRNRVTSVDTVSSPNRLYLSIPLDADFDDNGGSDQVQVIRTPEYKSVTVNSGGGLVPTAWNGSIGGVISYLCNGRTYFTTGSFDLKGKGFRGGQQQLSADTGGYGEGHLADRGLNSSSQSNIAGSGGGGGFRVQGNNNSGNGGGGGSYGTQGTDGQVHSGNGHANGGLKGSSVGSTDMALVYMGGAGGAGGSDGTPNIQGHGGAGGGLALIDSKEFDCSSSSSIDLRGDNGITTSDDHCAGGGGGAGGGFLLRAVTANIGTDKITGVGGSGGVGCVSAHNSDGGTGGRGRLRVEACNLTGTTANIENTNQNGGHSFCASSTLIL